MHMANIAHILSFPEQPFIHQSQCWTLIVLLTSFDVVTGQRKLWTSPICIRRNQQWKSWYLHTSCSNCFIINIKGHLLSLASKERLFFHLHHCCFESAIRTEPKSGIMESKPEPYILNLEAPIFSVHRAALVLDRNVLNFQRSKIAAICDKI